MFVVGACASFLSFDVKAVLFSFSPESPGLYDSRDGRASERASERMDGGVARQRKMSEMKSARVKMHDK